MNMLSTYENISTALFVAAGALAAIAAVLFFALHIWQVIGKLAGTRWAKTDEQVYELPKSAPPRQKRVPPMPVQTARKSAPRQTPPTVIIPKEQEDPPTETIPKEQEDPPTVIIPKEQKDPPTETIPKEQETPPTEAAPPEPEADRRSDVEEAKRRLGFRPKEKILVIHTQERI